jgi:hypothetical protein
MPHHEVYRIAVRMFDDGKSVQYRVMKNGHVALLPFVYEAPVAPLAWYARFPALAEASVAELAEPKRFMSSGRRLNQAGSTVDSHHLAVPQPHGRITRRHNRGNAVFPGNNGRV